MKWEAKLKPWYVFYSFSTLKPNHALMAQCYLARMVGAQSSKLWHCTGIETKQRVGTLSQVGSLSPHYITQTGEYEWLVDFKHSCMMQDVFMAGLQLRPFHCTRHTLYASLVCICIAENRWNHWDLYMQLWLSSSYWIHSNTGMHVHMSNNTLAQCPWESSWHCQCCHSLSILSILPQNSPLRMCLVSYKRPQNCCYIYLALFPGRSHLQYLITCRMSIQRGKAWENWSCAVTSGRQRVDTLGAVPNSNNSHFMSNRSWCCKQRMVLTLPC